MIEFANMAVPFNMPEDQNEVEVLLMQLQTLLNRLQVAVRRNQQLSQQQPSATASSSSPQTSTTGRGKSKFFYETKKTCCVNKKPAKKSNSDATPKQLNPRAMQHVLHGFQGQGFIDTRRDTRAELTATFNISRPTGAIASPISSRSITFFFYFGWLCF